MCSPGCDLRSMTSLSPRSRRAFPPRRVDKTSSALATSHGGFLKPAAKESTSRSRAETARVPGLHTVQGLVPYALSESSYEPPAGVSAANAAKTLLEVHHLTYARRAMSWTQTSWRVCSTCHDELHRNG